MHTRDVSTEVTPECERLCRTGIIPSPAVLKTLLFIVPLKPGMISIIKPLFNLIDDPFEL